MLKMFLMVGCGGFAGSMLRFAVYKLLEQKSSPSFIGTLSVNLIGCLLIGVLAALTEKGILANKEWTLLLTVGICGGFTTYSTFMMDTFGLLRSGQIWTLFAYLAASFMGGFFLLYLGYSLTKSL